jgi:peptidoglycan/LPS O-acetylase OafA/YrhL
MGNTLLQTSKGAAPRYLFIDGLRGIAASMVVLFHMAAGQHIPGLLAQMPGSVRWLFSHGDAGVFMFFVISGFVIANTLAARDVNAPTAAVFLVRRALRLDPPYWASIALICAVGALTERLMHKTTYALPSLRILLLHLTYLMGIFDRGRDFIEGVYWTLCLEIQFYITFAGLMLAATSLSARLGREYALDALLWPCLPLADLWAFDIAPFEARGFFVTHWYMFLTGVLVWRAVMRANVGEYRSSWIAALQLTVLGAAALLRRDSSLAVGVGTGLVVLAAGYAGGLTTWLGARAFQKLGILSYSLYLTHNVVTSVAFHLGYAITGQASVWLEAFWAVTVIAICLLSAFVFYRLFEAPCVGLAQRVRWPSAGNQGAGQPFSSTWADEQNIA